MHVCIWINEWYMWYIYIFIIYIYIYILMIYDTWYMIYDIWHMTYDIWYNIYIYIYMYTHETYVLYIEHALQAIRVYFYIYIYIYHIGFWRSFSPVPQLPQLPQSLHAAGHWSNRSHQVRGLVDLRSFTVWTPGRCHGWKPTRRWQSFSRRVGGMRLIELQLEQPDVEHVWQKPCAVHMIWRFFSHETLGFLIGNCCNSLDYQTV
jgi:hypothetical protein